jgi:hypothetical protein
MNVNTLQASKRQAAPEAPTKFTHPGSQNHKKSKRLKEAHNISLGRGHS